MNPDVGLNIVPIGPDFWVWVGFGQCVGLDVVDHLGPTVVDFHGTHFFLQYFCNLLRRCFWCPRVNSTFLSR